MTIQNYVRPGTLEEAYALNQKKGNRVIGGMLWTRLENPRIQTAIDLSDLGLTGIREEEGGFRIGAMTTLRELETSEELNACTQGAVRDAVRHIVGVQLRNMATVGGSLYSRFGFSDVTTIFLALDAEVELYRRGHVALSAFDGEKRDRDILTGVWIPKRGKCAAVYQSVRRQAADFPILTMAGVCREDGICTFAVGARPGIAVTFSERMQVIRDMGPEAFGKAARDRIPTGSNLRGSAAYRSQLVQVLAERESRALLEEGL